MVMIGLWAMVGTTGLLIIIAGWRGVLPSPGSSSGSGSSVNAGGMAQRVGFGLAGAVAAFLLTSWPVAGFYGLLAGLSLPTLAQAKRRRRAAVERVEAVAVWTESLRDTMSASAGIQDAIRVSARVAPEPIRNEVRNLAIRLQHQSVSHALRRFAAEMAHPLADMVVASLILATGRHAGSLQPVLAATAKGARDSATMMRHVESRRTRTYSQARMAGWVSFAIILLLILTRRSFLAPFDSIGGQVALIVIGAAFYGSGLALYFLSRPTTPRRLFQGIESWAEPAPVGRAEVGR